MFHTLLCICSYALIKPNAHEAKSMLSLSLSLNLYYLLFRWSQRIMCIRDETQFFFQTFHLFAGYRFNCKSLSLSLFLLRFMNERHLHFYLYGSNKQNYMHVIRLCESYFSDLYWTEMHRGASAHCFIAYFKCMQENERKQRNGWKVERERVREETTRATAHRNLSNTVC